ncbi:MAG: 50S ribosomal protein L21 [Candidatus Woykebacteria bacterium GWB1_45_5]|uniref:Large ribosomal subunit protein bL21 n=2 Tax=Candidatus Woykeibacteriota TaxID=1817899 RepID=A0A1G1W221_9BACT|nr:MAG: 50S ribosomal protein L21 [Candidatus Woykebacteria bacterium GWA1_44_8]OGY23582.1 MAG: 50S ribosomal protein L21 [Candidatus Woykebacteria bacterium GWB1_45_5]
MKYAVIRTGGKQYKVSEGQTLTVEKLAAEKTKPVDFKEILLLVENGKAKIGQPTLNAKVQATVVDQIKGKKIDVFKFKAKTGYHRKVGHRQQLTKVLIEKIGA